MFSTFQRSPKAWKGIRSMFHANIHRPFNGQGQQSPHPRLLFTIKESRTTCLGATGSVHSNASVVLCRGGLLVSSAVSDPTTQWTVAHQTPVHGIFQARILEWVAISLVIFPTQDQTLISCVSFIGRQILYRLCHLGIPNGQYLKSITNKQKKILHFFMMQCCCFWKGIKEGFILCQWLYEELFQAQCYTAGNCVKQPGKNQLF